MKGALVVVSPVPSPCCARTAAMNSPRAPGPRSALLFVAPGRDAGTLCLGFDRVGFPGLQRGHLDFLIAHDCSLAVQEFEDHRDRLRCDGLALQGLRVTPTCGGLDACT